MRCQNPGFYYLFAYTTGQPPDSIIRGNRPGGFFIERDVFFYNSNFGCNIKENSKYINLELIIIDG